MADIESKFRITASATGFQKLTTSAEKLAKAFKNVGDASEQMGKKAAIGLAAQQAALDKVYKSTRGAFGKASDALFGRRDVGGGSGGGGGGGGRGRGKSGSGPATTSTGHAAAMRIGQAVPGGGVGGVYAGAGYGGGGGRSGPAGSGSGTPASPKDPKSFSRGLLMGGLNIDYLNHDYGDADAKKQAAGISVGRVFRQTAGAAVDFAAASLEGPEAVASAIGRFPLGGRASRGLAKGIQAARQEVSAQGAFSSMMPYIVGYSGDFAPRMNFQRSRMGRLGMQYGGMSENQSLAAFGAASAQSGGLVGSYSDERLSRALQAQQGYGVDLGTSMRLLRGEDTGQAIGGRLSNQLGQALGNANKLGLEGGEVSQYLRQMAGNLEEVNQTGIKFSAAGQGSLERALSKTFIDAAGTRTIEQGRSLNRGLDQISQNGPQNSAQAMYLQNLGYDPSRPETYADALVKSEDPIEKAKAISTTMRQFQKTIGRYSKGQQQLQIKSFMGQLQTNISQSEARKSADAGTFGAAFGDTLERPLPMADLDLSARAKSNTAVSQQREAVMANIDTKIGAYQLDGVQESDLKAKNFTASVQSVGRTFLAAANSIGDVGRQLSDFMTPGSGALGANTAFR